MSAVAYTANAILHKASYVPITQRALIPIDTGTVLNGIFLVWRLFFKRLIAKLVFVNATKPHLKTVLTIRAKVLEYTRDWLDKEGFVEMQGPVLFPAFSEKPTHFMVNYFGKRAFLSAGLAPYSDTLLSMFSRIYTVAPTFRAEQIKSKRHLAEYWRIEACCTCAFEYMLSIQEQLLTHILLSLASNCQKELAELNSPITGLVQIKTPFPRLTYDKAIEQLQKSGFKVAWGEPIAREMEAELANLYGQPFFVTHFPLNVETVLYRKLPDESLLTYSADLLAPQGYGEIGTCNELITQKALLNKRLTELGVEKEDKEWYLNTKKNNLSPQSMISIGVERLLQWVCRTDNISETIVVPRQYGKDLF
jgi:asparaginyl-tRNA synthetase